MNQTNDEKLLSREEIKTDLLKHLEEKYKVEFLCHSIEYRSWSQREHESMLVFPKGGDPTNHFIAYRYENGQQYQDGYVGFLMNPSYYKVFDTIIKAYFSDYRLVIDYNQVCPDGFTRNTSFSEFKKFANEHMTVKGLLYVPVCSEKEKENLEEHLLSIVERLKKADIAIGIVSIHAYLEPDYQEDIVNDQLETNKKGISYPTRNLLFELRKSWGLEKFSDGKGSKE